MIESPQADVPRAGVGARLARSALWILVGTVLSRALTFLGTVAVARLLGRETFGALGVVQSTISTFQLFAGFGLGLTATKFVAELHLSNPERAGRIIGLSHVVALVTGSAAALLLALGATPLARSVLVAPELARPLLTAGLVVFLSAYNGSQIGALSGLEAFREIAWLNVISAIASVPLLVIGVSLAGIDGAVLSLVATAAITCALSHRELGRQARRFGIPITHRKVFAESRILWHFTVPAVLAGVFVQPVSWLCSAMLVRQPNGYWQMGVFNAASQWRNVMSMVPTMLMQGVLPVLARAHAEGEPTPEFHRGLKIAQSAMVLFSFPLATTLMLGADVLLWLFGREFPGSGVVLIGTIATALVQSIGASTGPAIEARGRMWFGSAINATWALVYFGFVGATVSRWGASSLAFGQAVAYLVVTAWSFLAMRRELPAGMLGRVLLSLVAAIILTSAVTLVPASARLWLALPATAAVAVFSVRTIADREVVADAVHRVLEWRRSVGRR